MARCKDCHNEKRRKYKRDNRDKINAEKEIYYNKNKERVKEKARLYRKEYYKKNKDIE